jgi:hypothetical protein
VRAFFNSHNLEGSKKFRGEGLVIEGDINPIRPCAETHVNFRVKSWQLLPDVNPFLLSDVNQNRNV